MISRMVAGRLGLSLLLVVFGGGLALPSGNQASAAEFEAASLFDTGQLLNIEITLSAPDWKELCRQTRWRGGFAAMLGAKPADKPFTYFKGDITIDGVTIPSVGIRKKGFFGSLDEVRPSLKIKFDKYVAQQPVNGLDRLTLNNNKQDASVLSQYLANKVFNDAGVHAPRCNLAQVTVNGECLGIYSNVESVREPFLKARFGDDSGSLYEGTVTDFHPKSVGKLEWKTGEDDRKDALRLSELLASPDESSVDQLSELVDIDYFLKFWAVESLVGFWDGYTQDQNNYFVYENPADGKYCFIPWGADVCFTTGGGPFARLGGETHSEAVHAVAILPNRLFRSPGIPARYKETMLEILDKAWDEEALLAEVDRVEEMTKERLHPNQLESARTRGWGIRPVTTDRVSNFIRKRRATILAELKNWPVEIRSEPRVPPHTVKVGAASGSFESHWSEKPSSASHENRLQLDLVLNGEEMRLEQADVVAQPMQLPRFGQPQRNQEQMPPASIVMKGTRSSDDDPVTLTLIVDRDSVASMRNQPISVSGSLTVGRSGFGFPGQMVSGTLTLSNGGTGDGDVVAGEFEVGIAEMRGGMFDGMRRGRGRR